MDWQSPSGALGGGVTPENFTMLGKPAHVSDVAIGADR